MDDNATCHRTIAVQDFLDSEGILRLVWPVRSPDLNPIENVWDALGRQVAGQNYPPTNKNTLIRALTEEWDKLPQQLLDNVVQSIKTNYDVISVSNNYPGVTEACVILWRRGSVTSRTIPQHIESVTHLTVYACNIRRRLQQSGLFARRPLLGLPLTPNHRCLRHQ
ncbi:uncharacterized protein TNCV_1314071 [Trichonephila clavipes]|nr:uncharacterized protein TNCV_1314071 [Trichonephila clavipes]